jgi:small subunit ribosomal protein S20
VANHDSALRQMRRSRKKRAINRANTAQLKTQVKKLRSAMEKGDAAAAKTLASPTFSELDRAAKKGAIHRNAANRTKSRLARKLNAVSAQ